MKGLPMQADVQEKTDNRRAVTSGLELLNSQNRSKLYTPVTLTLLSAVFLIGAIRWVSFLDYNGGPTGLFTQTDFPGVVIGSRIVASGQGAELYNLDLQLKEQQQLRSEGYLTLSPSENLDLKYPYPYAPFLAALWSPLSGLSPLTQMAIWDVLNIAAMAWGMWLLLCSLPLPKTTRLLLLLAALTSFPFIENLEQGQSSGIVMLGFALAISLLRKGRDFPAGLALGLLVLKIQWLPLIIVVLLWKRRWQALVGATATGLALLLFVLAIIGTGWVQDFTSVLGRAQKFAPELALNVWYSHSVSGQLAVLLGEGMDGLNVAVNNVAGVANGVITLLFAVLLLFVWKGRWQPNSAKWYGAMALTVMASAFTNPQMNTHDLSLLVLPGALGIAYLMGRDKERATWYGLLWAVYFVSAYALFTQPIRLTTLLMLLMLGLLAAMLMPRRQAVSAAPSEATV